MKRDRIILWAFIAGMALLIAAQVVGQTMLNHWDAKSYRPSRPDPAAVRQLSDY